MALVIKDRVRQTSTTAGTGTITLSGSVTGYQDFSVIGSGNTTYYTIADQSGSNWEVGLGTYTSPNQLSRDTVYESSNANALVNFGANIKDVFVTLPAEGFASPPVIGDTTPNTITGTTLTANTEINLPPVTNIPSATGVLKMVDGGDGYDYLYIYGWDGENYYPVNFPGGASFAGSIGTTGQISAGLGFYAQGDGTNSGFVAIREPSSSFDVSLTVPTTLSTNYALTLPSTSGSANQVLQTDGTGVTSWTDLYAQKTSLVTKAAAYTVVATDLGKTISCTPSTNFTVSLTAAATLGANFQCTIWNDTTSASGYVTIDPNGSETIDGVTTLILRRGEGCQIICDGTNWSTGAKRTMRAYAENSDPAVTTRPVASGTGAIALSASSGTASGTYSNVFGGVVPTASGNYSTVIGGINCISSGSISYAFGSYANAREVGKYAYGCNHINGVNAMQGGYLIVGATTTNATATKLSSSTTAAGSTNQLILQNNSAFSFTGMLVAKQASTSTNSAAWKIEGLIRRDASAAATTLVASTVTAISNVPAWTTPTLTADTTNGGLSITVTGVAATNIRWVATIDSAEVYY